MQCNEVSTDLRSAVMDYNRRQNAAPRKDKPRRFSPTPGVVEGAAIVAAAGASARMVQAFLDMFERTGSEGERKAAPATGRGGQEGGA